MRGLNVFSALLVLGCAVYISVGHTHNLFMSVGFNSEDAWVATLLSETMFMTGGLNLAKARLSGYKPSVPSYLGFIQGVALVGWSNIAATYKYGISGWLLGGSIVTAVLIMESIMTAETGKKKPKQETEEKQPERFAQSFTHRFAHVAHAEEIQPDDFDRFNHFTQSFNQPDEKADETDEFAHFDQPTAQPDEFDQPDETDSTDRINQPAGGLDDVADEADDQPDETDDQPTAHVTHEVNQPDESTDQPDEITQPEQPADEQAGEQSPTQPDEADEIAHEIDQPEPKTPRDWAMVEYEKTGNLPSRRVLAKLAQCTEYKAGNVLKELKTELGLAS
jgi:hypothetical protein